MVDVTPLISPDSMVIQGYAEGQFRISSTIYNGGVFVLPTQVLEWDASVAANDLDIKHFDVLLAAEPGLELILLGCGANMIMPPKGLRDGLKARNVALEVMDTAAACRTWNVLMAEGRRVAAALLPV